MNTLVLLGLCACVYMAAASTCPGGMDSECAAAGITCDTGYNADCVQNVCTCTQMHSNNMCNDNSDCGTRSCNQHFHNHNAHWRCWHGHCRCTFH